MAGYIAGYYNGELTDWDEMTRFCLEEIAEFEQRLLEVIRRDGIPKLADAAEHLMNELTLQQQQFLELQLAIMKQEKVLVHEGELVDNTVITAEVSASQASLRKKMFAAEKSFLEIKYKCYDFLSGVLTHQ